MLDEGWQGHTHSARTRRLTHPPRDNFHRYVLLGHLFGEEETESEVTVPPANGMESIRTKSSTSAARSQSRPDSVAASNADSLEAPGQETSHV